MPESSAVSIWRYVHHDGRALWNIGRRADGTLHNPNNYPEELVRVALAAAEDRQRQRRSVAAKKAAETRRKRTEARVYEVAERIVSGHVFGPAKSCQICGRALDDPDSTARGIGSECWQTVLEAIRRQRQQLDDPGLGTSSSTIPPASPTQPKPATAQP